MIRVVDSTVDDHELWLVVAAALLCLFASHAAFSLFRRARLQDNRQRYLWLAAAAAALGGGVWATHFVGMLAYKPPWRLGFDVPLTVLSAAIAMAGTGGGLWLALLGRRITGGLAAGMGIGAMHYVGMLGLEGVFVVSWNPEYVAGSLAVGMALAAAAFHFLPRGHATGRLLAVGFFAIAVCGLHFTAMTAANTLFDPLGSPVAAFALERRSMAIAVAAVATLLLGTGLLSAYLDGHLAERDAREAERLRRYVAELESTQAELRSTTRKLSRALEAAAASSQAKSQFLATMSHELRTPLNAIIGFSELLKNEVLGPLGNRRYGEYVTDIHDSGSHLLGLINDVLDFCKTDAGHLDLNDEWLDAGQVLADSLRLIAPEAEEAGIALALDVPSPAPRLLADPRRLKQIVLNLLSNAVKFTPSGGQVRVALRWDEAGATIAVADTGIGMSREEIPKAMEAFGQIDSSLNRAHEGTGLGLPLSRRMAEAHGGSLEIESAPGRGTTVTVRFPAERMELPAAA